MRIKEVIILVRCFSFSNNLSLSAPTEMYGKHVYCSVHADEAFADYPLHNTHELRHFLR